MSDTPSPSATSMRSHLCGELRSEQIGQTAVPRTDLLTHLEALLR